LNRDEQGRWQPGCDSPNPGGRPRGSVRQFRNLCIQAAPEVLEVLLCIAGDDRAKARDRIAASALILDRAFGKPQLVDDNEPDDLASTSAKLMNLISPRLREHLGAPKEPQELEVAGRLDSTVGLSKIRITV
jgi:hypothetical protein